MSILKRYFLQGQIYFITSVTINRRPFLSNNYNLILESISKINRRLPFIMPAWVIMPDHFHLIINPLKNDLSDIMHRIKLSFGVKYRNRYNKKSGRIWQSRFWDHVIRNEDDFRNHLNYIHYNPVKHRLAKSPFDWQYSSIHKYFEEGLYSADWGRNNDLIFDGIYGED